MRPQEPVRVGYTERDYPGSWHTRSPRVRTETLGVQRQASCPWVPSGKALRSWPCLTGLHPVQMAWGQWGEWRGKAKRPRIDPGPLQSNAVRFKSSVRIQGSDSWRLMTKFWSTLAGRPWQFPESCSCLGCCYYFYWWCWFFVTKKLKWASWPWLSYVMRAIPK